MMGTVHSESRLRAKAFEASVIGASEVVQLARLWHVAHLQTTLKS